MRLPPQQRDKEKATTRFVAAQRHSRSSVRLRGFFDAVQNHQNPGPISRHSNRDHFRTRPISAKTPPLPSGWCPFQSCLPLASPLHLPWWSRTAPLWPYSASLLGVRFVIDGIESVGDLFKTAKETRKAARQTQ